MRPCFKATGYTKPCGRLILTQRAGLQIRGCYNVSNYWKDHPLDWTSEIKIYWGFVFSFIQALFTAMPVMAAAYAINLVLEQTKGGPTVQTTQIFLITAFIILSILGRFWFSYLKARYLNGVGYETAADERIRLGDKLKKVSLGFYQNNNTGELTSAVTTDLSFLKCMLPI